MGPEFLVSSGPIALSMSFSMPRYGRVGSASKYQTCVAGGETPCLDPEVVGGSPPDTGGIHEQWVRVDVPDVVTAQLAELGDAVVAIQRRIDLRVFPVALVHLGLFDGRRVVRVPPEDAAGESWPAVTLLCANVQKAITGCGSPARLCGILAEEIVDGNTSAACNEAAVSQSVRTVDFCRMQPQSPARASVNSQGRQPRGDEGRSKSTKPYQGDRRPAASRGGALGVSLPLAILRNYNRV